MPQNTSNSRGPIWQKTSAARNIRRPSISTSVRDSIRRFLESEGHKTEIEVQDPETGSAVLRFRVRGQIVAVGTSERDPSYFSVSLAYALPDYARDPAQAAPILLELQASFKGVKFFYGHGGEALIAAIEQFSSSPDEFTHQFWRISGIVREAGTAAIERILDTSESKAAAEKFINDFMRGQR